MDKILETDWTKQVKQDMSGQPMSNDNGSEFSDLTPQQAKTLTNALQRQKDFMAGQQKKFGRLTKKDSRIVQSMEESDKLKNKSVEMFNKLIGELIVKTLQHYTSIVCQKNYSTNG